MVNKYQALQTSIAPLEFLLQQMFNKTRGAEVFVEDPKLSSSSDFKKFKSLVASLESSQNNKSAAKNAQTSLDDDDFAEANDATNCDDDFGKLNEKNDDEFPEEIDQEQRYDNSSNEQRKSTPTP